MARRGGAYGERGEREDPGIDDLVTVRVDDLDLLVGAYNYRGAAASWDCLCQGHDG